MLDDDVRDCIHQRTCVVFWEAVTWIARRDFSLPENRIGPRQMSLLPLSGDEERDDAARYELAHELLIGHAACGKIRLYARGGWSELTDEKNLSFPLELSPEFVQRAVYDDDEYEGPTLYVAEQESYHDIAVDYSDLIREFWGEPGQESGGNPVKEPNREARAATSAVPRLRRRGRRPQYAWPDFAAELVRRLLSGAVVNQAALERHMQEWCSVAWNAEPSVSEIRYWVAPAFKAASAAGWDGNSNASPGIREPAAE
jgi:hypothetical protein